MRSEKLCTDLMTTNSTSLLSECATNAVSLRLGGWTIPISVAEKPYVTKQLYPNSQY